MILSADVVNCVVSPGVLVGEGAQLQDCVLFPGARIGEGAVLRRAIVEEGVRVPPGAQVGMTAGSEGVTLSAEGVAVVSDATFEAEGASDAPMVEHHQHSGCVLH